MTHLQIRELFRTISGRFDLVNADGTDNGATFFLNNGLKYLDTSIEFEKSIGRVFKKVAVGDHLVQFTDARAIHQVWAADEESRWQLGFQSFQELRLLYSKKPGDESKGSPDKYTKAFLRPIPETLSAQDLTDLDWVTDYMTGVITDGTQHLYNGVLFMPPADKAYMIEVVGEFYTPRMSNDDDVNFWTTAHPDLVIMSAMLSIEAIRDWVNSINLYLEQLEKDVASGESAEVSHMKG